MAEHYARQLATILKLVVHGNQASASKKMCCMQNHYNLACTQIASQNDQC